MRKRIDKKTLIAEIGRMLQRDLQELTHSQLEVQAGSIHQEAKSEGDKDTRATESSYLARGLAKRVVELRGAVSQFEALQGREYPAGHFDNKAIALTALVTVEDDDGEELQYFMGPSGGGKAVEMAGMRICVVTPTSPLGKALLGRNVDDEIEVRGPHGSKGFTIIDIL